MAVGKTREVLSGCHFAVAVSGTVTLEVAHFGVPMVILYRVSRPGSAIGRLLVRMPHLSLVNILAGRRIVPELIPWFGNARPVAQMVMEVMDDLGGLFETRGELLKVVETLHTPPPAAASDNAAQLLCAMIDRTGRLG